MVGSSIVHIWPAVIAIVLLPGVFAWWGGRRLVAMAADPCLAERLWTHRRTVSSVTAVACGILVILVVAGWAAPWNCLWAIPLLVLGRAVGAFPARRRLLGETWSLPGYLRFFSGLWGGSLAFWVAVCLAPFLPSSIPAAGLGSLAVGGLLLAWNHWSSRVLRVCLGATPLDDRALNEAFTTVLRSARVPPPTLWRFGPEGGVMANALAVPSVTGNAVLFSNTLLERLTTEETAAILAHEVAHLEHFERGLWRWYAAAAGITLVGAILLPWLGRQYPHAVGAFTGLWPFVVLAILVIRVQGRQRQEAESDRRAVELGGAPEALISGLTRVHAINLLPRQWEARFEQSATHPSLARRILAIRTAAGLAEPAPVASRSLFTSPSGDAAVLFEPDGLRHLTGIADAGRLQETELVATASATRRFLYRDLVELRLAARDRQAPTLCWMERAGKRWCLAVRQEDLSDLRATIETKEGRIGSLPAGDAGRGVLGRGLAVAAALIALLPGWHALLVTAVASLLRPGPSTSLAMSVAFLAGSAVSMRDFGLRSVWPFLAFGIAYGLLAMPRGRRASREVVPAWLLAFMAVSLVAAWALWAADARGSLVRLIRAAHEARAILILPLAFTTLLFVDARGRASRIAALLTVGCALAPLLVTSPWFAERFVHDPLLQPVPAFRVEDQSPLRVIREERLDASASMLRIAPGGGHVALGIYPADPRSRVTRTVFVVTDLAGHHTSIEADDLQFAAPDRLVTLKAVGGGLELQDRRLEAGGAWSASWTRRLPGVDQPGLALGPDAGRWQVTGGSEDGAAIRLAGTLGQEEVTESRWRMPEVSDGAPQLLVGGERVRAWNAREYGWSWLWEWAPKLVPESSAWPDTAIVFDDSGATRPAIRSTAEVVCLPAMPGRDTAVCAAYDGRWTTLTRVDPAKKTLLPIGKIAGEARLTDEDVSGFLALRRLDGSPVLVLVDPVRRVAVERLVGPYHGYFDVAQSPGFVAVSHFNGRGHTRVTVFGIGW